MPSAFSARTPPMPSTISCWYAGFAVAAVEPRGQVPVPWRVFLEIGVEQEEDHSPDPHAPHGDSTVRLPSGTAVTHGLPSGV